MVSYQRPYAMKILQTEIPGVLVFEPKVFGDERGFFIETFQVPRYAAHGLDRPFLQDNLSRSRRGILRGLHLQNPRSQGKLVSVLRGRVLDVAGDVRVGSPPCSTIGKRGFFYGGDELYSPNRRNSDPVE
jgi:dTDP-4-dehydrorhamnose 3,5-epimerase